MGWFWADATTSQRETTCPATGRSRAQPPSSCPVRHKQNTTAAPVSSVSAMTSELGSGCPVKHNQPSASSTALPSYVSKLNPLNYMPESISNKRESTTQSINLPLEREASTIPRGDGGGTWEYPSPQQMYNAMLRKGYTDTPAEHVESMVAVHNFLNEGAWEEIKGWEARFGQGLVKGWERCAQGEEGYAKLAAIESLRWRCEPAQQNTEPKLLRFQGRPDEPSPRARMLSFMAWIYPAAFPHNPPFDRHDWFIQRHTPDGKNREVRYVIDYYSGPPEPTGEPVFYLDVRPAVDGPTAACERMVRWGSDVWWRASGGSVREELARQKK